MLLTLLALVAGCGESSAPVSATAPRFPDTPRSVFGGARPVTIQVPHGYDAGRPTPLLVVLHGYGFNGTIQAQYLRLTPLVETEGFLMVAPDGTVDSTGSRFWNTTDDCCTAACNSVDDIGYIRGLIDEIRHDYNVDPKRIYLVGHSNGAFMAHRLACVAAHDIAAIVSLAGATYADANDCAPSEPVHVLDIHGDADSTIDYGGGTLTIAPDICFAFPGEADTMAHWQTYDRCTPGMVADPMTLNLDNKLAGNETAIQRFEGCARGAAVDLWTIHGGGHIPTLSAEFAPHVWQWLSDHPKP
jgi:polyhydroxybutyrate depolymerase